MYKVGKIFMEDANITIDSRGQRIVLCPICGYDIDVPDDKLVGDIVICDCCEISIKLVE